jgi:hypothetical protein
MSQLVMINCKSLPKMWRNITLCVKILSFRRIPKFNIYSQQRSEYARSVMPCRHFLTCFVVVDVLCVVHVSQKVAGWCYKCKCGVKKDKCNCQSPWPESVFCGFHYLWLLQEYIPWKYSICPYKLRMQKT